MRLLILILILIMFLNGCDPSKDWSAAPVNFKCTAEQMNKVNTETKQAIEINNGEKYSSYWYGSAIIRNCELIKSQN